MSATQSKYGEGLDRLPGDVLRDIERICGELEAAGDKYSEEREKLAGAEMLYEQAIASELLKLYNESKEDGSRLPAEDLRKAMAHSKISTQVWASYITSKAKVDALDKWIKTRQSILSAYQSELSQLKIEWTHAG